VAQARQSDRDIGLGAADMDVEPPVLKQQLAARRGQPKQQFPKADDPPHEPLLAPADTARQAMVGGATCRRGHAIAPG